MITISFDSYSVIIKNTANTEDERQFDQGMIVRRSRAGNLIQYRDTQWSDFDILIVRSKTNIKANIDELQTIIGLAWGDIITIDVVFVDEACNSISKRYTGLIITNPFEIVTMQDDCSYDISFELLIESEGAIP